MTVATPLPAPKGLERICVWCFGTGRVERARACSCQQPDGVCDNARLACRMGARVYRPNEECDGWIYTFDFCSCEAGRRQGGAT